MRLPRQAVLVGGAVCLSVAVAAGGYKVMRRVQNRLKPVPAAAAAPALDVGGRPPMPAAVLRTDVPDFDIQPVAGDLKIVWAMRWAADGRLFVTERPGRLLVLEPGAAGPERYATLPTALGGESGLMGLALHPRFPRVPYVYVMYTARKSGGGVNRISRFVDTGSGLADEKVFVDDIPAARNHDGGALEFGPDGMLYAGTGDADVPTLAQDLGSLNGKILRLDPDGHVPGDNPFPGSPVWAYGFRNVSGLAFHPRTGELWAASHGPSSIVPGEPNHMDSVYIVRKGGNHGWPLHLGVSRTPEIVSPVIFYPERAVPPGGLAFTTLPGESNPSLIMTSLGAQEIERYVVHDGSRITRIERWWPNRFGRLRAITVSPDGNLYVGTSNGDGRAEGEYSEVDAIFRLQPTGRAKRTPPPSAHR